MKSLFFYLLLLALLLGFPAWSQNTGSIKGVLADSSGAVIPAANVTLTGVGVSKTAQSQADGSYTFPNLGPGQYTVSITFPGFVPFSKQVTVTPGNAVTVPIELAIVTEKQEVTVQAQNSSTVSVEPDNNATALVMKGAALDALPDDPDDLSDALQALAGPGAGPNGGSIYIDGFSGGQLPPKESIREIRINQNPFSAEYDRLGFGRIEILTKPGSDKLRGTVNFNDGQSAFNSRNPFSNNKPDYSTRMWSANIGGPLGKKASFFMDFNRRDVQDNALVVATYFDPTALTQSAINTSVVTPTTFTILAPRLDYAISTNNTLTVRVEERLNSRDNNGVGGTSLPAPYSNLAYRTTGGGQNVMVTETSILTPQVVNETRFQFFRNVSNSFGNELPQINVAGSFVVGGNGVGTAHDTTKHFELQNYTSISHGVQTIRFGVRLRRDGDQNYSPSGFNGAFTFLGGVEPELTANNAVALDANGNPLTETLTSIEQYERTIQLLAAGFPETQIQALGGGPSRFTITAGQPYISGVRYDAGPFVQDDWRVQPNFTLSLGLRYEAQTLAGGYGDVAPRLGFAYAPGKPANGRQKTVFRGGFGIFYDRITETLFENAALNNGVNRLNYTVYNPTFYPNIPALSTLTAGQNTIDRVDPNLKADYSMQSAIGVERQLPHNTTASLTYTFNRSVHLQQTIPINTPLPGTFNPSLPLSATNGVFPYGYSAGTILETESGGFMRQHLIMASFNTRLGKWGTLFGNYSRQYAKDLSGTPTDPYDFALDYGRSNLDRRNNFQLLGTINAPEGIKFAPFVTLRSGAPYDVTIGEDVYGDTLTNARAVLASNATCAGIQRATNTVCTPYGTFSTAYNVLNTGNLVSRNYLTMPGLISVNMRVYRTWSFGGRNKNAQQGPGGPPGGMMGMGGPGGGPRGGGGPGGMGMGGPGMGGMFGGPSGEGRYSVTLSANIENVLNHLNPGGYSGVITSPLFLTATSANTSFGGGGPGGGGFGPGPGAADNRRIQLSLRFQF